MDELVGKDANQNPLPGFHIGADNAMFGADYPHFESIVPNTMDKVAGLAGDPSVTDDDTHKILFDNAAKVYDFDRAVLHPTSTASASNSQTCSPPAPRSNLEERRKAGRVSRLALSDPVERSEGMTVTPAALSGPQSSDGSGAYVPPGEYRGRLDDFHYVEEE